MITLDDEDWIEIFYALDTKVQFWEEQDNDCCCGHSPCEEGCKDYWIQHLRLGGHPKPAIDGQLKTGHRK